MITLFRAIRYWQLKIKWKLAIMQFIDQETVKFIKNPEEVEKKIVDSLVKLICEANNNRRSS